MTHVEVAVPLAAALGESPVWDADRQRLHLIDIFAQRIHCVDPDRGAVTSVAVAGTPGALALRADGGYVGGVGLDLATIADDGAVRPIVRLAAGRRVNDGKCDPRGRFVAGTMTGGEPHETAALYQLHADGALTALLTDVTLSNGLDWSPAGDTFYHVDTVAQRVSAFDYDLATGQIRGRRVFADLRGLSGRPDGLTVDAEGGVWVVVARAGIVHRYRDDGRLDAVVEFPTPIVTSCAFGGPALDTLFVTSSRGLLTDAQRADDPVAGCVFAVEGLGVRGRLPHRYPCTEMAG